MHSLTHHILTSLRRYDQAVLPGIGAFRLHYTPAAWDRKEHMLYGPKSRLSFTTVDLQDSHHRHILPYSISFEKALASAVSDFRATGSLSLPGIGIISSTDDSLAFSIDSSLKELLKYPDLYLNPQPLVSPTDYTKKWWKWALILAGVGTLALSVTIAKFWSKPRLENTYAINTSLAEEKINQSPILDTALFLLRVDTYGTSKPLQDQDMETRPPSAVQASHLKADECVIITGVFTKSSNLKEMKARLEDAGFDIYQASLPNGSTRIGALIDCSKRDIEKELKRIKISVEYQAWILK
jgi:hypothetical protein